MDSRCARAKPAKLLAAFWDGNPSKSFWGGSVPLGFVSICFLILRSFKACLQRNTCFRSSWKLQAIRQRWTKNPLSTGSHPYTSWEILAEWHPYRLCETTCYWRNSKRVQHQLGCILVLVPRPKSRFCGKPWIFLRSLLRFGWPNLRQSTRVVPALWGSQTWLMSVPHYPTVGERVGPLKRVWGSNQFHSRGPGQKLLWPISRIGRSARDISRTSTYQHDKVEHHLDLLSHRERIGGIWDSSTGKIHHLKIDRSIITQWILKWADHHPDASRGFINLDLLSGKLEGWKK